MQARILEFRLRWPVDGMPLAASGMALPSQGAIDAGRFCQRMVMLAGQ